MKKALCMVLVAALAGSVGTSKGGEKKAGPKEAHLGLAIQAVPSALYSQMAGTLPKGQGVVVDEVEKDSPAAKAGLHADDILMSFGDQKLYSPEQLVKLVRADKPGHEVALGFLRGGKSMNCKVMLGEAQTSRHDENPNVFRFLPDERMRKMFGDLESKNNESIWDSFDEIKLTRMDDKRWRADVAYRNKEGKKSSKHYTGTRDEIRKSIQGEKDLPANERSQLLRALNLHEPVFEFHFPPIGMLDSGPLSQP